MCRCNYEASEYICLSGYAPISQDEMRYWINIGWLELLPPPRLTR